MSSRKRPKPRIHTDEFWLEFDHQGWFGRVSGGGRELELMYLEPDLNAKALTNLQTMLPRLDDHATTALELVRSKMSEEIASYGELALEYVDITSSAEPGRFILGFGFSGREDIKLNVEFRNGDVGKVYIIGAGP